MKQQKKPKKTLMSNPTKFYSNIQESKIAKYLNWEVVSGSGARDFNPGDIKSDMWLGECKTHEIKQSRILFKKAVWAKISSEAFSALRMPVLFVDNGTQNIEDTWCMISALIVRSDSIMTFDLTCNNSSTVISFDHDTAKKEYQLYLESLNKVEKCPMYKVSLGNHEPAVMIFPLTEFAKLYRSVG